MEHKYDHFLRHFSSRLLPEGATLPQGFVGKICLYLSDLASIGLIFIALFSWNTPWRRLFLTRGALFLWAFFFCSWNSIVQSPLSGYWVLHLRLVQFLSPMLLYFFLAHQPDGDRGSHRFLRALVFASLVQTAIAIAQYFHQGHLGLSFLGEAKQMTTGLIPYAPRNRWLFDRLFHIETPAFLMRGVGTLTHSNAFGGFMSLSLLATYTLFVEASRKGERLFWGATLPFQFFALAISFSRSAFYGWLLGTMFWFGYVLLQWFGDILKPTRVLALLALWIGVSVAVTGVLLSEQIACRGGVVNYNDINRAADRVRLDAQDLALHMIQNHPSCGVGFQQFTQGALPYRLSDGKIPTVHNMYLLIAAETGLFSLGAFLACLVYAGSRALQAPFSFPLASLSAMFCSFLFIGCCDMHPIFAQQMRLLLFATLGLLAGYPKRGLQNV